MDESKSKIYGWSVVLASWLAVFCLFGYRAVFAILKGPLGMTTGWTDSQVQLGYSLMMVFYAITAYFSGMILDKWGTKPVYAIAAVLGTLGYVLTAQINQHFAYLVTFGLIGGIATGMLWVTSTVSVRKWYIGRSYATMWGFAFAGAPMAQFILAQMLKPKVAAATKAFKEAQAAADPVQIQEATAALEHVWKSNMVVLGIIVGVAMFIAVLVAKNGPETYGMKPFGAMPTPAGAAAAPEYVWGLGEAFSKYAIWAVILTFLTSMMGEFLIWTQVVSYWTKDVGLTPDKAISIYQFIGIVGIFSMPILGKVADMVVKTVGNETKGRKIMLFIGPLTGVIACVLLLMSKTTLVAAYVASVIFAIYWAIVLGGAVGYCGSVYGRKTLGKIWGLATLIVMGIGPFTGVQVSGFLKDHFGNYTAAVYFALCAFVVSMLVSLTLPLKAVPNKDE